MQRSRGKGNRRFPGRDGGARRGRLAEWVKRAQHVVSADELGDDIAEVDLRSTERPEQAIYRFDQIAASEGWQYAAELTSSSYRTTVFRIIVNISHRDAALSAADRASQAAS